MAPRGCRTGAAAADGAATDDAVGDVRAGSAADLSSCDGDRTCRGSAPLGDGADSACAAGGEDSGSDCGDTAGPRTSECNVTCPASVWDWGNGPHSLSVLDDGDSSLRVSL